MVLWKNDNLRLVFLGKIILFSTSSLIVILLTRGDIHVNEKVLKQAGVVHNQTNHGKKN